MQDQSLPVTITNPTGIAKAFKAVHTAAVSFINSLKLPIIILFFCAISSVTTHLYFKQVYSSEIIEAKTAQIQSLNDQLSQLQTLNQSLSSALSMATADGELHSAGVPTPPEVGNE